MGAALLSGLVLALVLGVLAVHRFDLFVIVALASRTSLDALRPGTNTSVTDPASVLSLLMIAAGLLWMARRRAMLGPSPVTATGAAGLVFLGAAACSTIGSQDVVRSAGGLVRLVSVGVAFAVIVRLCRDRRDAVVPAAGLLGSAIVPLAVGLGGLALGLDVTETKDGIERLKATFTQSNPLGFHLAIVGLVLLAVVVTRRGWIRSLAIGVLVLDLGALVLTGTRLAWAGFVVGAVVSLWRVRRASLLPAVAGLAIVLAVAWPFVSARIEQATSRPVSATAVPTSLEWRLQQWEDSAALADESPLTGIGLDVVPTRLANGLPPHNDLIRVMVETGLVGLAAFVVLLGTSISVSFRARRTAREAPPADPWAVALGVAAPGVLVVVLAGTVADNLLGQVVVGWYAVAVLAAATWLAELPLPSRVVHLVRASWPAPRLPSPAAWAAAWAATPRRTVPPAPRRDTGYVPRLAPHRSPVPPAASWAPPIAEGREAAWSAPPAGARRLAWSAPPAGARRLAWSAPPAGAVRLAWSAPPAGARRLAPHPWPAPRADTSEPLPPPGPPR